jgi:transcriptional/translational regulatory protein YebC/TACO1
MAGHHKWSKVTRLNGALDAKRGKLFSRLAGNALATKIRSDSSRGPRLLFGGILQDGAHPGNVRKRLLRRNGDRPAHGGDARSTSDARDATFRRSRPQRVEFKRNHRVAVLIPYGEEEHLTCTPRGQFDAVGDSLRRAGLEPDSIELIHLPEPRVAVYGQNGSAAFLRKSEAVGEDMGVRNAHPAVNIAETHLVKIRG